MIRLIRFLITGDWHLHEWEKPTTRVAVYDPDNAAGGRPVRFQHEVRCKHCGKVRRFKT